MVLVGFEPTTGGLKVRCSDLTELQDRGYRSPKGVSPQTPLARGPLKKNQEIAFLNREQCPNLVLFLLGYTGLNSEVRGLRTSSYHRR